MIIWNDTPEKDIPCYEKIEDSYYNRNEQYEMVKLGGDWYGPFSYLEWNGWHYGPVKRYKTPTDFEPISKEKYTIEPIQRPIGNPDEDGEYQEYETIGYKIGQY